MEQLFVIKYASRRIKNNVVEGLIFSPQEDFKKKDILDQIEMLVQIEKEVADYRKQLLNDAWQNQHRSL